MGIESEYATKYKEYIGDDGERTHLSPNRNEINGYEKAIVYLNDKAKLQEMVDLVITNESLQREIEASLNSLQQYIEKKTAKIEELQETLTRPKTIKGFFQSLKDKMNKSACQQKRAKTEEKIQKYKRQIAKAQRRIAEIEEIKEDGQNPEIVASACFGDLIDSNNQKYSELIALCRDTIDRVPTKYRYFFNKQLFVEDENGTLTVNQHKTSDFIKLVKDKESIGRLRAFANARGKREDKEKEQKRVEDQLNDMALFLSSTDSEQLACINSGVNRIIREYNKLLKMEEDNDKKSFVNKVARFFGSTPRTAKAIMAKRVELYDMIMEFVGGIEDDKDKKKLFNAYSTLCQAEFDNKIEGKSSIVNLDNLREVASQLMNRGRVGYLEQEEQEIDVLIPFAKMMQRNLNKDKEANAIKLQKLDEECQEASKALKRKDRRIFEELGEVGVVAAQSIIENSESGDPRDAKRIKLVLELLEGLTQEVDSDVSDTMGAFKYAFGEEATNNEIKNMNTRVFKVITTIKKRLNELTAFTKPKDTLIEAANKLYSKERGNLER